MERGGRHQPIQGGGSGWGLEIPSQIREENDCFFDAFMKEFLKHSKQAVLQNEVRESERNRDGELWRRAIVDRMECLRERCSAYASADVLGMEKQASILLPYLHLWFDQLEEREVARKK